MSDLRRWAKMKIHRSIKVIACVLTIPTVFLAVFGVIYIRDFVRGSNANPKNKFGYQQCREAYERMTPLIAAVDIFYQWKGRLPESAEEIRYRVDRQQPGALHPLYYMKDEGAYSIYLKTGWDDSVIYRKERNGDESLIYDPGDGGSKVAIEGLLQK
jgi:hypothetical protein